MKLCLKLSVYTQLVLAGSSQTQDADFWAIDSDKRVRSSAAAGFATSLQQAGFFSRFALCGRVAWVWPGCGVVGILNAG